MQIQPDAFKDDILTQNAWVLVDFSAPWCGLCRMVEPLLHRLTEEWAGNFTVVRLNVDDQWQLARRFAVAALPTLILFHHGIEVGRCSDFRDRDDLLRRCEALMQQQVQLVQQQLHSVKDLADGDIASADSDPHSF